MIVMKEIVQADKRCTNIALESFGICSTSPVMNAGESSLLLEEKFGKDNVYEFIAHFSNRIWNYIVSPDEKPHSKIGNSIPGKMSIKAFSKYVKENNFRGHYILNVNNHALALHYTRSGEMYIIDNEEKFLSGRVLNSLYMVDVQDMKFIYEMYMATTTNDNKIMRVF